VEVGSGGVVGSGSAVGGASAAPLHANNKITIMRTKYLVCIPFSPENEKYHQ
jgi:hypothetical protein